MAEDTQLPILADTMRTVSQDVGIFINEVSQADEEVQGLIPELRERLLLDRAIHKHTPTDEIPALGAVDAASLIEHRSGFALLLTLGVRVGDAGYIHNYQRYIGHDDIDFSRLAQSAKFQQELALLHDTQQFTIADHSFWSLLMVANQTCHYLDKTSGEIQQRFQAIYDETLSHETTFIHTLRNPFVIGMSKIATGDTFARKQGLKAAIADRTLFSLVLHQGEYVTPRPIKVMTNGSPGVETDIAHQHEIEGFFRNPDGLLVTFYKPWDFQHAYRIEFHATLLTSSPGLADLLTAIQGETRFLGILEPRPQFLADQIAKQISAARDLYVVAGQRANPSLMGIFRTSQRGLY